MPSSHLILCRPLLLLPSIFPSIRVFSSESVLHIRWPKYWSFIFQLGEGNGKPLQYSCQENPMDGGAWWATVHGVASSRSRLSNFTFTFYFHALEKEMATQYSCLENPKDGVAWWASVYGVAQSRTQLKRLSSSSSMNIYRQLFLSTQLLSCLAIW